MAALPPEDAEAVVDATEDGRIVGEVQDGEECVAIRGMELV